MTTYHRARLYIAGTHDEMTRLVEAGSESKELLTQLLDLAGDPGDTKFADIQGAVEGGALAYPIWMNIYTYRGCDDFGDLVQKLSRTAKTFDLMLIQQEYNEDTESATSTFYLGPESIDGTRGIEDVSEDNAHDWFQSQRQDFLQMLDSSPWKEAAKGLF